MTTKEREEVISILSAEGVPLDTTRALLRAGATLHRLAELECSSEAADRDRVPCPAVTLKTSSGRDTCLCEQDGNRAKNDDGTLGAHGDVTRISVKGMQTEARVRRLCADAGLVPEFGGDPRGAVLVVKVPSGRTNDWGKRGIVVG